MTSSACLQNSVGDSDAVVQQRSAPDRGSRCSLRPVTASVGQQNPDVRVGKSVDGLGEDLTISVERMMRFCHLAQMQFETAAGSTKLLPLHLTRFGALVLETSSFLYSLFEDRPDSINLVQVWRGVDHPFGNDLQDCVRRLDPFKEELKLLRNRLGFHGSLSRSQERDGLGIFDVDSGRARDFARLVRDMQQLFLRMIAWYMKGMDASLHPAELWNEFVNELKRQTPAQDEA
jgi:hypothetical protein